MKETVDKDRSFAYFVYPFLFDLPAGPAEQHDTGTSSDDPFYVFAKLVAESTLDQKRIWTDWGIPANDLMPCSGSVITGPYFTDNRVTPDRPPRR